MAELIALCTDLLSESEKSHNPILVDSLAGLKNHRILKQTDDDTLKTLLKYTNQMLNEPRTRTKGLMLLENFLSQVESARFVGFQVSLQSTLNLLTKCLDLDLTHQILVHLLPLCHKLPELNQTAISGVIPKLMSRFCENSKSTLPTYEEISSVICCLERYRGPCGQFRFQVEKFLISLVDSSSVDDDTFSRLSKVLPLLSATGGGGNKGDKYSQDWFEVLMKILENMHNCVVYLYSDTCPNIPTRNPYTLESSESQNKHVNLNMETIRHPNVLMRISLAYRRLLNLSKLLTEFLSEPFPAPKPIPVRGIIQLITNMMMINPVNILKKATASNENESVVPKENIHLAALLPSIHQTALEVLKKLILSCESQLFPEGASLELLIVQQLKWISERPGSFETLKCQLYSTVESWLKVTNGSTSSNKNATLLVQEIIQDIKIDKHSVSLSLSSSSKAKKGNKQSSRKQQTANLVNASKNVSNREAEEKSSRLCSSALDCLLQLIPSLDFSSYRAVYIILATTIGDFVQAAEQVPSPYDSAESRKLAFQNLTQLALNPHPKSPISVGLITCLLEIGSRDPDHQVSTECHQCLSMVERIIHPSCETLQFPQINIPLTSTPFSNEQQEHNIDNIDIDEQIHEHDQEEEDDNELMTLDEYDSSSNNNSFNRKININKNNRDSHVIQRETSRDDDEDDEGEDEVLPSTSLINTSILSTNSIVDASSIKDCVAQALRETLSELGLNIGKSETSTNNNSKRLRNERLKLLVNDQEEEEFDGFAVGDASDDDDDDDASTIARENLGVNSSQENVQMDHLALVKDIKLDGLKNKSRKSTTAKISRNSNSKSIEPPTKKVKTGLVNGNHHDEDGDDSGEDEEDNKLTKRSTQEEEVTFHEMLVELDDTIVFAE